VSPAEDKAASQPALGEQEKENRVCGRFPQSLKLCVSFLIANCQFISRFSASYKQKLQNNGLNGSNRFAFALQLVFSESPLDITGPSNVDLVTLCIV
jgi:hypothetical protein